MLKIENTRQFRKDLKKYKNDKSVLKELDFVIKRLSKLESLEKRYKDHSLTGNWTNYKECHIKNDVLLIYRIYENDEILILERIGSHSELFD